MVSYIKKKIEERNKPKDIRELIFTKDGKKQQKMLEYIARGAIKQQRKIMYK